MLKTLGLILSTAMLMVVLLQGQAGAQSTANLQTDLNTLRSQVTQLQAEIAQLRTQRGGSASPAPAVPRRTRAATPSDGQIIDRLATLAIEAKERLNALESRVTRLERR